MENCVARTNWFRVKDPIGLMSALDKEVTRNPDFTTNLEC